MKLLRRTYTERCNYLLLSPGIAVGCANSQRKTKFREFWVLFLLQAEFAIFRHVCIPPGSSGSLFLVYLLTLVIFQVECLKGYD